MRSTTREANDCLIQRSFYAVWRGRELPLLRESPSFLSGMLTDKTYYVALKFREHIRLYNSMFSYASIGDCIDLKVINGVGLIYIN